MPIAAAIVTAAGTAIRPVINSRVTGTVGASTARFSPDARFVAVPGYVYGGLIASLIDCHGTATAAAALCQMQGRELGDGPVPRFVTAALKVDYLAPTPLGPELELEAMASEVKERKVVVDVKLRADGVQCASGQVVAVLMPAGMLDRND